MSFYSASKPATTSSTTALELSNDASAADCPTDSISSVEFSPVAEYLSVGSWDGKVRLYEVMDRGVPMQRAIYDHQGPVLDVCWSADGSKVASGGADNVVRAYDLGSGQGAQLGMHDAPVRCVEYVTVNNTPMVASAGWDKKLRYWDPRQSTAVATIDLPERAYASASMKNLLVVASADKQVSIINLNDPGRIYRQVSSVLRMQLRAVACHDDGNGYAIGSIEGRCAIQYVDQAKQTEDGFSFKCHRQLDESVSSRPVDQIYAVNAIDFHAHYPGSFATGGANGCIMFWDKISRCRLKHSKPLGGSVPALSFSKSGKYLAYAISYDWSQGYQYNTPQYPTALRVHVVTEDEVRSKKKK